MEKISIDTVKGPICAAVIPDAEYPGISLCFAKEGSGEPGAIMEYDPVKDAIILRIYSKENPEGDPVEILAMT